MSANVPSLQTSPAPARSGSNSGGAAKGGPADGASSDFAQFQRMLGRFDAGAARNGTVQNGAALTPPAGASSGQAKSDDPQCAEVLDELEDLLAMLPALPWQASDGPPDPSSGSSPGASPALVGVPAGRPVPENFPGMAPGEGSGIGLGVGMEPGRGTAAVSVLAEAKQLLAVLESGHADAPADTVEPFAPAGASGEAVLARTGPAGDALLARTVPQSVGTAAWADEIAARVNVMAEHGRHTASLRLSPEHLGPLEIRIAVRDDQASVWFGAAHPDTRAALEAAMPRLREMFAVQGLSLADTGVFHEAPRQPPEPAGRENPLAGIAAEDPGRSVEVRAQVPLGLLDTYA